MKFNSTRGWNELLSIVKFVSSIKFESSSWKKKHQVTVFNKVKKSGLSTADGFVGFKLG